MFNNERVIVCQFKTITILRPTLKYNIRPELLTNTIIKVE